MDKYTAVQLASVSSLHPSCLKRIHAKSSTSFWYKLAYWSKLFRGSPQIRYFSIGLVKSPVDLKALKRYSNFTRFNGRKNLLLTCFHCGMTKAYLSWLLYCIRRDEEIQPMNSVRRVFDAFNGMKLGRCHFETDVVNAYGTATWDSCSVFIPCHLHEEVRIIHSACKTEVEDDALGLAFGARIATYFYAELMDQLTRCLKEDIDPDGVKILDFKSHVDNLFYLTRDTETTTEIAVGLDQNAPGSFHNDKLNKLPFNAEVVTSQGIIAQEIQCSEVGSHFKDYDLEESREMLLPVWHNGFGYWPINGMKGRPKGALDWWKGAKDQRSPKPKFPKAPIGCLGKSESQIRKFARILGCEYTHDKQYNSQYGSQNQESGPQKQNLDPKRIMDPKRIKDQVSRIKDQGFQGGVLPSRTDHVVKLTLLTEASSYENQSRLAEDVKPTDQR